MCPSDAKPYSKAQQLAKGERRYRRKVASPKQWQAIIAAKRGPCRIQARLGDYVVNPYELVANCDDGPMEYHHVVERDAPHFGDDVQDNIVPLCRRHHEAVTQGSRVTRLILAQSLTLAEREYVLAKVGAAGLERLFGGAA